MSRLGRRLSIALAVAAMCFLAVYLPGTLGKPQITVGFIYDNDEDTPYSRNFRRAQLDLEHEYGSRVKVMAYTNVLEGELAKPMQELSEAGASIVFTNNYGDMRTLAAKYPNIQICQASSDPYPDQEARTNYHTFKGEVYQARYVSGVLAGLKLKGLLQKGAIGPSEAKLGFVAAFPYAEVVSGYTAFLLGARSVVPTATMDVCYIGAWENYMLEKDVAALLLDNGCQVISQHTDTVGPAVACEEYYAREVFHVGYNIDMRDEAPNASLASVRICWEPYVLGAVRATMAGQSIEESVKGAVHPKNDMSAGYDRGWVELTDLNTQLLGEDDLAYLNEAVARMRQGATDVFKGPYVGVNPADPTDVCRLDAGFCENADSSIPSFAYVLQDIVRIVEYGEVNAHASA